MYRFTCRSVKFPGDADKITPGFFCNLSSAVRIIALLTGIILLAGCAPETDPAPKDSEVIREVNFEEADFAPFVEPDFPFITTSIDARSLGPGFPTDNIVPRCLALRLGGEAYACFDTDMLRWSVAWTGEFLPMVTMGQISYNDFHNKDNEIPTVLGEPSIATGLYPGWSGPEPDFTDPRPPRTDLDAPVWGPVPGETGRWKGVYLQGQEVVLSYAARNTDIYEKPGSTRLQDETGFTRTIQIGQREESLSMVAAEVSDGTGSEVTGNAAYIYRGEDRDSVTAIGLAESVEGVELNIIDDRYSTVQVSSGRKDVTFTLVLWSGPADKKEVFEQMLAEAPPAEMPDFREGGAPHWTETVVTEGQVAPDTTSAYVIDQLTLPIPNPWNRNVRVVDVAFFDDGRAAVVTFSGDVWIVEGIDEELENIEWRRYASGLYETQSVEVVDDTVYTYGKEGIVRFHDLNEDGVADYYENFSNRMAQSIETREWATDMVAAPGGGFFVAKAGGLDMGPKTSFPAITKGFRAGSRHSGSVLKVSAEGRSVRHYATGLRGPYLGINPETGVLTASDQQGHYVPSTPLLLVEEGDYFGVPTTAHRPAAAREPDITPPLVWFPHSVDRSGIGQVWITSDRMGPLSGSLVHLSYGRPGLFKILIDSTGGTVQGGIADIPADYPAPTMKGAVSPADGQLYLTGFTLWGTNSSGISAFTRLRYTGRRSLLPQGFLARDGGIILRFDTELDEEAATNPGNYQAKRWNYRRTEDYGSGHFKLDGSAGEELMPVFSAHLSDDRKAVFLAIPDMREVMQMEISYDLKAADGTVMDDALWFTVNDVEEPDPEVAGFSGLDIGSLAFEDEDKTQKAANKPEKPASAARGKELYQRLGCMGCHSTDGTTDGMIGPTLQGLFGSEQHFEDGSSAIADEGYIRESLLEPEAKIVEGHAGEMPSFLGILSDREMESMVLYIKTLSE
ncbi:Cytochrome c2 [Fodinibius roseus]|uniref:Cytochrome c2 n=1 Tax=Fodinibius roseus TaxID=1194090 RepID=A0A1M5GTX3_9BACT|nr:cytochrome c [Fodinibius roseus]SHG07186.1 Cytochrome c2 [Fodinibius roseus]